MKTDVLINTLTTNPFGALRTNFIVDVRQIANYED